MTSSQLDTPFKIYDPLHGAIPVTELERNLMLTPPLIRARNIKQLGTAAYLRNAPHNRLMHCLGVLYLVDLALDQLFDGTVPDMQPDGKLEPGSKIRQIFRLAGLLHDIGHGPMSHVYEDYLKRLPPEDWQRLWKECDFPIKPTNLTSRSPKHEHVTQLMIVDEQYGLKSFL